eukprot:TRINITY_DN47929_c0_g1_i2.p1 TRINITY_DN47929_c0_g1~~TRINITY_DN47929_c0_g1_i2.p1  ORF type:complete len:696 (+),score=43.21 TRINITY_DN47929_c0_g1_i2:34-2121(+)
MKATRRIALVGLGPHARRIYYPLLEKYAENNAVDLPLVVDVQSGQQDVQHFLSQRSLRPASCVFVNNNNRYNHELCATTSAALQAAKLDGIILSTEPKAHKPYLRWALEAGVDVLVDKPVTVPFKFGLDLTSASQVYRDFLELSDLLHDSTSNVLVQCQRRSHKGYQFIKKYLTQVVSQYQIPLSFIDIYHADGMWCTPQELFHRENHPYKYGYGKLMHSGYHFVDLLSWLLEVNMNVLPDEKRPTTCEMFTRRFGVSDFLAQCSPADFTNLLPEVPDEAVQEMHSLQSQHEAGQQAGGGHQMGELDVFANMQFRAKPRGTQTRGPVITTCSMNLQQNSFSRRAWWKPNKDVYKGNGRVRHERLNLQVGNSVNIQVHSYQSHEVNKATAEEKLLSGAGNEHHWEVHVYRNAAVIGGPSVQKFTLKDIPEQEDEQANLLYQPPLSSTALGQPNGKTKGRSNFLGHNEEARAKTFRDFMQRSEHHSHLDEQNLTCRLLAELYGCLAKDAQGETPFTTFSLPSVRRTHSEAASSPTAENFRLSTETITTAHNGPATGQHESVQHSQDSTIKKGNHTLAAAKEGLWGKADSARTQNTTSSTQHIVSPTTSSASTNGQSRSGKPTVKGTCEPYTQGQKKSSYSTNKSNQTTKPITYKKATFSPPRHLPHLYERSYTSASDWGVDEQAHALTNCGVTGGLQ